MPLTLDLPFTGLDEFVNKPVVENRKFDEEVSEIVRKNDDAPIIEEWVSGNEEENVTQPKVEKKKVKPSYAKIEFVKPKGKAARKTAKQHMVPRAVLMKSGLVLINTARQNISKTAVSVNTARQVNTAHSKTTVNAARPMVNIVKDKNVNAARPKMVVNTAKPKALVNAVQGNNVNAVKASACWDKEVIDSGCSRHMTGNMSYLTDYEEIDGGYVAIGGNLKGGKITGR
ncbi:hypothetical protein Tco_1141211, partial [Tanacetum coccineum]